MLAHANGCWLGVWLVRLASKHEGKQAPDSNLLPSRWNQISGFSGLLVAL